LNCFAERADRGRSRMATFRSSRLINGWKGAALLDSGHVDVVT
jgi:hypothetical protein